MPRTAENVIRESNMPLAMAYDYLAAARLYAAYVVLQSERFRQTGVTETSLLSPDEFLRIVYPDVPPGVFDFMDPRITMLEEVQWPDLESIYGDQW
ncbi:hypothetical protein FIBSPDRAFT_1052404 [Athelia psychrophila]|uniref:Uncharacterized protein n=1 Tax=Athelia psychrophila TaxID=1759441 RepID=A0A165XDD8_9AGAM|nr:hypothetical protein FIBSPDRAFT_1052404 [Fibularhizoctonia sp. CBS 109695]